MKAFLDNYGGGFLIILMGMGLAAFGGWDLLPKPVRDAAVMGGVTLLPIGVGFFQVERKLKQNRAELRENTVVTVQAADAASAAAVKAEDAVAAATSAAEEASLARRTP